MNEALANRIETCESQAELFAYSSRIDFKLVVLSAATLIGAVLLSGNVATLAVFLVVSYFATATLATLAWLNSDGWYGVRPLGLATAALLSRLATLALASLIGAPYGATFVVATLLFSTITGYFRWRDARGATAGYRSSLDALTA